MRVFSVESDGGFTEYERLPFKMEHEESVLEKWLESNPDGILENGRVLIIGRQVGTDLGGFIDLLGIDRGGNVVVVELKRDRTPRNVVAQALEYTAFAARLDVDALEGILRVHEHDESLSLADLHRELCLLFIHPSAHGSEVSPAARNTLDSARIPRASKLLICSLFQKGRVLAQDEVVLTRASLREIIENPPAAHWRG